MPKSTDALLLRDRLRVCTPSMTQTLQAHPLREKRCLQFKKLRWISISHPRVSLASSAKTAGAPRPGLPSLPPRAVTTLPVIYVYTDLLHIFEGKMRLPHLCIADTEERGKAGEASLPVQGLWKEVASLGHRLAA